MSIYRLFAGCLDYPVRPIASWIGEGLAELSEECPEAAAHLAEFQNEAAARSLGQLQEAYTNAFDLRPDCTPNVSYHLFGDDGRRGLFLAELKGRMQARAMPLGSELPDHLSLMLQYLDIAEEERAPVIQDCLLPAVLRMVEAAGSTENPYRHALRALLSLLEARKSAYDAAAEAMEA